MPIYPSAHEVTRDKQEAPQKYTLVFKTDDPGQAVLDFYHASLISQGWIRPYNLLRLPTPTPKAYADGETYFWADRAGSTPWKLMLTIDFWAESRVHVEVERWPEIDRVPIFPDAQKVETRKEAKGLVVSYMSKASPTVVAAYNSGMMPEYGWQPDSMKGPDLYFTYQVGGPELMLTVLSARIHIATIKNQTQVEIHAGGVDEMISYWQDLWGKSK